MELNDRMLALPGKALGSVLSTPKKKFFKVGEAY
jgi:hypothetical protein